MIDFFADVNWTRWAETAWTHGLRVVVIIVLVLIALRVLRHMVEPAIRRTVAAEMAGQPQVEVDKRITTLSQVAYRTISVVVLALGLFTVLPEFGINTSALIAGTGLFALALGFGAQSLVKDVISGLFILVENQYAKGDVVNVAGVGGLVEDVNLRRTVLRDLDGAIHSIPNGQVEVASNLTRSWSRANMIVTVSYSEDMDHVFEVVNGVGKAMQDDPDWAGDIVEAPKVLGVEAFGDSGIDIRILGVTQPIRQWDVMRELRRRLKRAFDEAGIEIPYPHRTLVSADQKAAQGLVVWLSPSASDGKAAEMPA
jgi:moderate conductance mechanosensitive channel